VSVVVILLFGRDGGRCSGGRNVGILLCSGSGRVIEYPAFAIIFIVIGVVIGAAIATITAISIPPPSISAVVFSPVLSLLVTVITFVVICARHRLRQ
jgi:uncharacterized protein YacL